MPDTEAGRALESDVRELAEAFHQVGLIRNHADINDSTGWNVRGIETCGDRYCVDALHTDEAIEAIEQEASARTLAKIKKQLVCEDPEEPCDADGRDEHRWCDNCIARVVIEKEIGRLQK